MPLTSGANIKAWLLEKVPSQTVRPLARGAQGTGEASWNTWMLTTGKRVESDFSQWAGLCRVKAGSVCEIKD